MVALFAIGFQKSKSYSISRLNKVQIHTHFINFINELNIIFVLHLIGKRYIRPVRLISLRSLLRFQNLTGL